LTSGISMFDWPEPIHTSPNKMSSSVMRLPAEMVMVCGPPAFPVRSVTCQLPSSAVLTDITVSSQSHATATFSPGSAQPQTITSDSRCSTMCDPRIFGRRTSARQGVARRSSAMTVFRMIEMSLE